MLVELGDFKSVEFIFCIQGYTKNVCDRLFNLLKIRYHKVDIFTMSQLVEVLNASDTITFKHVEENVF